MNIKRPIIASLCSLCFAQAASATVMTLDGDRSTWNTVYDSSEVDVEFQTTKYNWVDGYNDLINVAYAPSGASLIIDFIALGSATVTLDSFDLGNWLNNGAATKYSIYDLSNLSTALVSVSPIVVTYSTTSHPTYNIGLSSTTGIRLEVGPDLYNIGIDNIAFSTSVPEPTTVALLGFGLAGLGFGRKRKVV